MPYSPHPEQRYRRAGGGMTLGPDGGALMDMLLSDQAVTVLPQSDS